MFFFCFSVNSLFFQSSSLYANIIERTSPTEKAHKANSPQNSIKSKTQYSTRAINCSIHVKWTIKLSRFNHQKFRAPCQHTRRTRLVYKGGSREASRRYGKKKNKVKGEIKRMKKERTSTIICSHFLINHSNVTFS